MDVRELRIGNWVSNNVESFQIQAKDLIFLLAFDNEHYAEPIKLTEELLLKFGFEHKSQYAVGVGSYKSWVKDKLILLYDLDNNFYAPTCPFNPVLKYIHQLMNLYYFLTGEELEVK